MSDYRQGGYIKGGPVQHVAVRRLEGSAYSEYWEPEGKRWIPVISAEQIEAMRPQLDAFLKELQARG